MIELTHPEYWDKNISAKSYPNLVCSRMDRELAKIIHPFLEAGNKLVELGCGCSYMLPYFAKTYNMEVTGIDYSRSRLFVAQNNLYKNDIQRTLYFGDFKQVPKELKEQFDLIYSGGVLEHFKKPEDILNIFKAYVKPNGLIIVTIPHMKGFWGNLGKRLNKEADSGYLKLDMDDLVTIHKKAKLKIIHKEYFRAMDFSILNYSRLPKIISKAITGMILAMDIGLYGFSWLPKIKLPEWTYADMVVVSQK